MALRLRKDVQKASYYVWFLGAQEAKGLRGQRVLLPAIPRLIERSREQEPLKVTLQVSHKGLKIIQGSSKHFIPHSAITCSVQTDDVVACVLLLYNPATRCPLHVHAYRCDSESTAQALHQQLQILINRPENQKRFNELESRLGLQQPPPHVSPKMPPKMPKPGRRVDVERATSPPRRFESSLGSDDMSTRESECSGEHSPTSPISPVAGAPRATLYDSLAAELRAKLNGNGPPLLLPPRDYDTMHRSKGNLAATELRRCQNQLIVGGPGSGKQGVSSRGSSGIGSDLAPSPERQDGQTSSDEDWTNDHQESVIVMQAPRRPAPAEVAPKRPTATYLYPHEPPRSEKFAEDQRPPPKHRLSAKVAEERQRRDSSQSREEEEVKPVLMKNRPPYNEARFREVFEQDRRFSGEARRFRPPEDDEDEEEAEEVMETPVRKRSPPEREAEFREKSFRENLTDKQKYMAEKYRQQSRYRERPHYPDEVEEVVEKMEKIKYREKPRYKEPLSEKSSYGSRDKSLEFFPEERNPYQEPESQPYRESIEKMLKSPVMRYKSFDEEAAWQEKKRYGYRCVQEEFKPRRQKIEAPKASPKERFHDAKEKFQAMERSVHKPLRRSHDAQMQPRRGSLDPPSNHSLQRQRSNPVAVREDWSSDEEQELPPMAYRGYEEREAPRMAPSKSLGNLVKGYRHSYAEPRNPLPRGSGRVGLAAVNPY
ncbi:hepatoma-derived growth factor-related protein 2 [Phlebotomus argentipes]|uniref:hepatoma-derived growth factor-related protein 2 n=1 Tax=Phlebotomus argentipes TaxID=94469 RepID=UPI002892EADB|nr:hepatoma-derived growth factor-related protein 2 [Phlebotomus argentipes]